VPNAWRSSWYIAGTNMAINHDFGAEVSGMRRRGTIEDGLILAILVSGNLLDPTGWHLTCYPNENTLLMVYVSDLAT
jgi:hypothetical protein